MPTAPATASQPPARRLRVFVVENHDDTRFLLRWLLEHAGHTVEEATTMQEALAALPAADADVLISDVGLPDGDGWELLRTVRLAKPIYAIAMTGFGMSDDVESSRAAGYRHHLVKPVDPDTIERLLAEAAAEIDAR